jgi:hypothetical protein
LEIFLKKQFKNTYEIKANSSRRRLRRSPGFLSREYIKKQKVTSWEITTIKPEDRTLKNLPKYANKKSKVRFQDWLELKKHPKLYEKFDDCSWGWSPNGKCYGWSHRAVHGFKIGDKIKKDTIGNTSGEEWTIKTNEQAEKMAKLFAKDVA